MNFIEKIKESIKEYKQYKNPTHSKALTVQSKKNKNIYKYMQAKSLERKYGDALYKHFEVMNDIESYDFLIRLFGKRNIEKALNDEEATTAEIADKFLEIGNIKDSNEIQTNYVLKNMMNCIIFNRATGLNLSEFKLGIMPEKFYRKALDNKSMLNILDENKVTKDILKEIYDIYRDEIISCYNEDAYLRNKTVLKLDGKYENISAVGGLQDHITDYSEKDFITIFEKYFSNEELSKTEQYILIGLLAKEADLIGTYTVKNLKEHYEYIKSEIKVGIFDDIILSNKRYTNNERKKIVALSKVWKKEDLKRYNNLELLRKRLESLSKTQKTLKDISTIDEILSKSLDEVTLEGNEISDSMDLVFMDYEIENRNQIIDKVYNPPKAEEIVITDLAQIDSATMLHFFHPNKAMSSFNIYVKELEEKKSKEIGKKFEFSEDEKKAMLVQYQTKENKYITDYALDFEGIGQVGSFDTRYVTNTSNQLCAMITTPKEILSGNVTRGKIALGFSKETLNPELIVTTSNKNIHSNKGIDYVESNNEFKDFSASYDELASDEKTYGGNNEIVLFRNSSEASLKPSYVMYIGDNKLDSEYEKKNIKMIKEQMVEAGLKVPLVIFDRFSIKEKTKNVQLKQNKNNDIEER